MEFYALVCESAKGEKKAMEQLINLFGPLLKKYTRLLCYEDAYNDLCLSMIALLRNGHLLRLSDYSDAKIKAYIKTSVKNEFQRLSIINNHVKKEAPIDCTCCGQDDEDRYAALWDKLAYAHDFNFCVELDVMEKVLTQYEFNILIYNLVFGYHVKEISRRYGVSMAAISRAKKNAIQKLRLADSAAESL